MHNQGAVETDTAHQTSLIICPECDLLQMQPHIDQHAKLKCRRCDTLLVRSIPDSIERTVALAVAGWILFIVANLLPFLSFEVGNQATHTSLVTGVGELYQQGEWLLSLLVLFTAVLAPAIQLFLLLYIFVPLGLQRTFPGTRLAFRALQQLRHWNMIEVFMIGILVALVKLTQMATIVPGVAMWSFMLLIFVMTAATASIDARRVWQQLETPT